MNRNPAIELYRCSLMLGICVLHAITNTSMQCPFLRNVLYSCVVGFVFISGWFGVKFSWRKLIKLYGVAFYAVTIVLMAYCIHEGWKSADIVQIWIRFLNRYWFLHAYAFMMMLAPLVNAAIEKGGKIAIATVSPLILLVWCWGFGLTLPIVSKVLPHTDGLSAYGGITLLAIYAAARICRMIEIEKNIKPKWLFLSLPVLWMITGCGFGSYNSPFAFALAGACFFVFSRLQMGDRMGRIVVWLAPSMFSVYMIHTNAGLFTMLNTYCGRVNYVGGGGGQ